MTNNDVTTSLDAVFVTVALAMHPREGRSKHARVNLPVSQLQGLTAEKALSLIGSLAEACGAGAWS